jgi:protein-S-isoprenylcysteine O-methyltransferase Ste14
MPKIFDWPPVWLGLGLVAVWALARALPLPLFGLAGDVAGVVLVVAGLGLMALAARTMVQARTTVIPRRVASSLVTTGVFRISRNPIYLGDSLILVGTCLILDTMLGFAVVPLFVWPINTRFIDAEEAGLAREFGQEYRDWCAAVRRWV